MINLDLTKINMPTHKKMQETAKNLPNYISQPSIEISDFFSNEFGCEVHFLRADQNFICSYKDRGAYIRISSIINHLIKYGYKGKFEMIAASEGNHAQGVAAAVAYFSKWLSKTHEEIQLTGKVFMPETTPKIKIQKTIDLGLNHVSVKLVNGMFEDADNAAKKYISSHYDYAFYVPPFDSLETIEGQGTLWQGLENIYDEIIMSTGGGGLISSAAIYFDNLETELRGVQPAWAPTMIAALCAGYPIKLSQNDIESKAHYPLTVDGATLSKAGNITYSILKKRKIFFNGVTRDQIAFSLATFIKHHVMKENSLINYKKIPELAGILPLACLYKIRNSSNKYLRGKKILCVLSGSNIEQQKIDCIMHYVKQHHITTFPIEHAPFYDPYDIQNSCLSLQGWISDNLFFQLATQYQNSCVG